MKARTPSKFLRFLYSRGVRLPEASRKSGIPLGTLQSISAGNRKLSPENRRKLARALRCRASIIP